MVSNAPSAEQMFADEWGKLVGLWRVWDQTRITSPAMHTEAADQLAKRLRTFGIGTLASLSKLTDPGAVLDALRPVSLLGPPPDPRFGPMVMAESAEALAGLTAKYRLHAAKLGGLDDSFLRSSGAR